MSKQNGWQTTLAATKKTPLVVALVSLQRRGRRQRNGPGWCVQPWVGGREKHGAFHTLRKNCVPKMFRKTEVFPQRMEPHHLDFPEPHHLDFPGQRMSVLLPPDKQDPFIRKQLLKAEWLELEATSPQIPGSRWVSDWFLSQFWAIPTSNWTWFYIWLKKKKGVPFLYCLSRVIFCQSVRNWDQC